MNYGVDYKRAIPRILYRQRGQHQHLIAHINKDMPVEAMRELFEVLRNMEDDLNRAKRTYRPFPGGPKIRM